VYVAITAPELALAAQTLAGELREGGINVAIDFGERKLGDQIKAATMHKIPFLIVVGEDELAGGQFKVRNLASGAEEALSREQLVNYFLQN
jgi:histidyl-tRNA synthetase